MPGEPTRQMFAFDPSVARGARSRIRRGVVCVGLVLCGVLSLHVSSEAVASENPHGGYGVLTVRCMLCHDLHDTASADSLLLRESQVDLCYMCHDGTGSVYDTQESFEVTGAGSSHHPVPEAVLQCGDCHTPHEGPAEGNPSSLAAGDEGASSGTDVCAACHGVGSTLPGGDVVTPISGSPHDVGVVSGSAASITCQACHEVHGSTNDSLLKATVTSTDSSTAEVTDDRTLCLGCHNSASSAYPGSSVASASPHSSVTSSTKAATVYPGSGADPSACVNCHDPHGAPGQPDYLRTSKDDLCYGCHDADGVVRPAGYSYDGVAAMGSSAHSVIETGLASSSVSYGSGDFQAWESTVQPTPSAPGTPVSDARLEGLRSIDGGYLSTRLAVATGDYDYQMYRFQAAGASEDVRDVTLRWKGYGEEVTGNPVTLSAWDWTAGGGVGAWEQLASQQMTNDTTLQLTLDAARHVNADNEVYVLASARNQNDATITSGPTLTRLSSSSIRVYWTTSGLTDGWVEYGTTPAYGSIAGSSTRSTGHSVTLSGLLPGVYHYRVTSESRDGESVATPDARFGMPSVTTTPVPDYPGATSATINFEWTTPVDSRRPFDYRVRIERWNWTTWTYEPYHTSAWLTDVNSYSYTLPGGYWYQWTVDARDFEGVSFGHPPYDEFEVGDGGTGSCPMLFTNTAEGVRMESDLLGAGKLGLKTKNGYVPPEPQEVYVLKHEPAEIDGTWDLRFVEERYEADYLDRAGLYVVDLPESVELYAEKPQADGVWSGAVQPALHTISDTAATPPGITHLQTGRDVTGLVSANDDEYLILSDDRNVDFEYQTLELDLGDVHDAPQVKVVMDAMSVFPDTSEGTSRSATFGPRTKLEVQDAEGNWVGVPSSTAVLPKPPEFSRPYVFDISDVWVSESRKVRFTFLFKTYVDWIAVDTTEDLTLELKPAPLLGAELRERGMDPRTSDGEIFGYVYGEPTGITRYFAGAHTKFGDVAPLLAETDDTFVIFGGGDELAMRFESLAGPEAGMRRHWVFDAVGYYKNAKIQPPFTVEPLPFAAMSNYPYPEDEHYPDTPEHQAYLEEWNTRVYGDSEGMVSGNETLTAEVTTVSSAEESTPSWFSRMWQAVREFFGGKSTGDVEGEGGAGSEAEPLHRSLNTDFVGLQVAFVGDAAGGTCIACHAVHGQVIDGVMSPALLWTAQDRLCTGAGVGCHADPANSVSGRDIEAEFSASTDSRAHHDVDTAQQIVTGARIACSDCHNPHVATAASQIVDPDNVTTPVPATFEPYMNESRYIYLAVGAEHDAVPPVMSNLRIDIYAVDWTQPVIRWTTNEGATSWVDYGTTTAYELGTVGSGAYTTTHAVTMPSLTPGVTYYLRVRTADAPGNETVATMTYIPVEPPPAPTVVPEPDIVTTADSISPTLEWSAVTAPDGDPVEYYAEIWLQGGSVLANSGWISGTSWTTPTLNAWDNPTYVWHVRARDASHTVAMSPWSASDSFYVDGPVYSCPDLYTWNGEEFTYVTDVMGLGGMAIPKGKDVYVCPEPVEDTIIPPGMLVGRDGSLDIHLTDEKPEIEYIDDVELVAIDHPVGTRLLINDLSWNSFDGGREPTEFFTIKDPQPVQATYERLPVLGTETIPPTDVSEQLAVEGDASLAHSGLYDDNIWTFDLGRLDDPDKVKLVVSGWVEYANKREKDAWVASGKRAPASFIEVQDAEGNWIEVGQAPHMPGYPKTVVYDLTDAFPEGGTEYKVRMRVYMRMHLDYVGVDTTPDEAVVTTEIAPRSAELSFKGVSDYEQTPYPNYDYYDIVNPDPASRTGSFTRFGDVRELLLDADDRYVIMDTGDDLAVSFDEPPPPASGMTRTYMIHADGYHNSRTGSVEPLPFHGMSGYPYGDDEHYPDTDFHTAYREEWNTRHKSADPIPQTAEEPSGDADTAGSSSSIATRIGVWLRSVWEWITGPAEGSETTARVRVTYEPREGSTLSSPNPMRRATLARRAITPAEEAAPKEHYSINTDMIRVSGDRTGTGLQTYAPVAGWTSVGTSAPPPISAPGTATAAANLTAAASADGTYWITDEASTDKTWNWQVVRVEIPEGEIGHLETLRFEWRGYGEPTTGYGLKFAVWDFDAGAWTTVRSSTAVGSPVSYMGMETAVPNWFCVRCHDGSPPPGVIVPAGVSNIGAYWNLTTTSDGHGPRAGSGTGGLKQGLARGMDELPCVSCHESHGNQNLFHISSATNGTTGISVTNGNSVKSLCSACHFGTATDWHAECDWCHSQPSHGAEFIDSPETAYTYPYPNDASNCLLCHNHGSKSSVGSDGGRGVRDVDQAAAVGGDCHPCHDYRTTF